MRPNMYLAYTRTSSGRGGWAYNTCISWAYNTYYTLFLERDLSATLCIVELSRCVHIGQPIPHKCWSFASLVPSRYGRLCLLRTCTGNSALHTALYGLMGHCYTLLPYPVCVLMHFYTTQDLLKLA